jgi:two-component system, NtrC family, sensor kinase
MTSKSSFKKSIAAELTVYILIYLLGSTVAYTYIDNFIENISSITKVIMLSCVFVLTALASYLTIRQKLGVPLEKLANSFETISSSTYQGESLPLHQDNEIGAMAKSFNRVLKNAVEKTNEMAEEIIERNKIQKKLAKSETQFKQLAEHIDEVLWLCSADGMKMHYVSPAYEKIYGRSVEDFYQDPHVWLNDIHVDDRAKVIKNFAENGIKGNGFTTIFRIVRPDGEERIVCDTGFPIFDQDGNLYRIAGTVRDITEQKKTEERIQGLQRRYEYILHSAGEGIIGLDTEGKTAFTNPAACLMLGWEKEDIIGKNLHEIAHHSTVNGSSYDSEDCPIYKAFNDGEVHKSEDEVFWNKEGTSFPVEYVSTPIRDVNNNIAGAVVVFRDISRRKQMETELQMAQKLEAVGQLAAGIAHEINTPAQYVGDNIRFINEGCKDIIEILDNFKKLLNAATDKTINDDLIKQVNNVIETADLDYLLEEMPLALNQSQEGIESISNIVRAMKEFSHPGSNDKDLVDINHIIENTITVTKNEWKYVSEIKLDLDKDLPSVPCYAQNIGQVFMNLIVNASHAIADVIDSTKNELGTISIATRKVDDEVEIIITDSGKGIPEEIREKVFDPFFTTKGVGKGTGQGLAIARSAITDKHQGSIKCLSEVGKGTTFIIRLPIQDPNAVITEDAA